MRIDYSEPKQAYVAAQGKNRPPRKEPVGRIATIIIITAMITFIAGFGTGWVLSQRSAKRSFQAATEQNSLENTPKRENPKIQAPAPQTASSTQQPPSGAANTPGAPPATPVTPETPLSFYKTLPSGQKGNVMGSGINYKDDKGKQPLQAAIPSNLNKPSSGGADTAKGTNDKPQGTPERSAANGFTVQVASYSLKSEAETLKNKLAGKGYNVIIAESNQGDKGTWYRVRVGKRLEQDAAKELAGKLGKGALVIPDRD